MLPIICSDDPVKLPSLPNTLRVGDYDWRFFFVSAQFSGNSNWVSVFFSSWSALAIWLLNLPFSMI